MRQGNVRKRLFVAAVVAATVAGIGAWAIAIQPAYATTTGTVVPLTRAGSRRSQAGQPRGILSSMRRRSIRPQWETQTRAMAKTSERV